MKKVGNVFYDCASDELGIVKRRSHQILKYPYDDYEDEARTPANQRDEVTRESKSDTNFESLEDQSPEGPEPADHACPQLCEANVTRYNGVI